MSPGETQRATPFSSAYLLIQGNQKTAGLSHYILGSFVTQLTLTNAYQVESAGCHVYCIMSLFQDNGLSVSSVIYAGVILDKSFLRSPSIFKGGPIIQVASDGCED